MGWQPCPSPPEVTPATTSLVPKLTKSGPPESPRQVSEFEPGGPRGLSKVKQTWVALLTPMQEDVITEPTRLIPERLSLPSIPKPAIVAGLWRAGFSTWLRRLVPMPVTGRARVRTARSLRMRN